MKAPRPAGVAILLAAAFVLTAAAVRAAEPEIDMDTGMVIATDWELVKAHCTVCHSAAQFTQQRGSRETWRSMIRWMQETQGLWQFDAATENRILDYLESNYAPALASRRAPLPADLMPPSRPDSGNSG